MLVQCMYCLHVPDIRDPPWERVGQSRMGASWAEQNGSERGRAEWERIRSELWSLVSSVASTPLLVQSASHSFTLLVLGLLPTWTIRFYY